MAQSVDLELLAATLPDAEAAIVAGANGQTEMDEEDSE